MDSEKVTLVRLYRRYVEDYWNGDEYERVNRWVVHLDAFNADNEIIDYHSTTIRTKKEAVAWCKSFYKGIKFTYRTDATRKAA